MDDDDSFSQVIENLKGLSTDRDPRLIRLASVTSALAELAGDNPVPTKFFASAIETLEGTLHQKFQDADAILDSLATQMALLDIICLSIPHIAPGTLAATAPLTSRVLRGVVHSCRSIGIQDVQSIIIDTQDGLGGVNALLCSSCKTISELLRYLPSVVDKKIVVNLLNTTILSFLKDSRAKLRSTAVNELCGLLAMDPSKCHAAIKIETSRYVKREIEKALRDIKGDATTDFVDLLGFLQHSAIFIDFTTIGKSLMEILINLLSDSKKESNQPVFVTKFKDTKKQVLILNAILSTILAMLEHETGDLHEKKMQVFAARVLATLVQVQPTLTFRYGSVEDDLIDSGRSIFGQVMLSACQKLLTDGGEPEMGSKLLPLMIQHIVNLSRPTEDLLNIDVAETLMPELSQLFRMQLKDLKNRSPDIHNKCSQDCLAVMENLLQSSFQTTWTVSLKTLVILLQQMDSQNVKVKFCIKSMLKLRCEISANPTFCHAMDDAISSLIQNNGIEGFMNQMEMTSISPDHLEVLPWLLPLMKVAGSIGGTYEVKLAFFHQSILPLARYYDALFMNEPSKASSHRSVILALWALFPCFCRNPTDLEYSLPKLAPLLVRAMNDVRYPELVVLIGTGLKSLASGVSDRLNSLQELNEGREALKIRQDAQVVGTMSEKLIPSLFKLIEKLHLSQREALTHSEATMSEMEEVSGSGYDNIEDATRVRAVTEAIASLARLASKQLVQSLFSKVLQRLLEASQSENDLSEKMCMLLTLSQALVISESLDISSISLLYRSLKPLIRTDQTKPRIQKRAYKVLAEICDRCIHFVQGDTNQFKDILELLSASMATSQVSARYMRIKCLNSIVRSLEAPSEGDKQLISGLIGETLLSLKDSNGKTREAAFVLLQSMAERYGDLESFIRLVTAAIGSKTTHMRSAAVVALSRLIFAFADDFTVQSFLPSLLKTVLVLSDDPSREVAKSLVGFVRVAIVVIPSDHLQPLLPHILHGLLKYHRGKDRFRSKIKIILKKLVKFYGYDTLMPLVPQSESRLLTHMRKLSERELRRKAARRDARNAKSVEFDEMIASDEEDSDDGRTLFTGATGMSKMTNRTERRTKKRGASSIAYTQKSKGDVTVRIRNDTNGTNLDVRDLTQKSVRFADANLDESDSESLIQFDDSGKLVVKDDEFQVSVENNEMSWNDNDSKSGFQKKSASKSSEGKKNKRRGDQARLGSSYKARTAGGDVKKKGQKYDPYAYVPLDGRSYTRKNRHLAVEQMSTVVQRGRKRQKR